MLKNAKDNYINKNRLRQSHSKPELRINYEHDPGYKTPGLYLAFYKQKHELNPNPSPAAGAEGPPKA